MEWLKRTDLLHERYGGPGKTGTARLYRVTLSRATAHRRRLLVLSTLRQVRKFDAEFGKAEGRFEYIDWAAVSEVYGGIEFRNYDAVVMKMFRMKKDDMPPLWYHTVDVDSGCIWDPALLSGPLRFVRTIKTAPP